MSAVQHEYYIRQPSDIEARGPFTFAQLSELADSGGIDARTLYFDAANEQWIPLAGSDELGLVLKNKSGKPKPAPASGAAANTKPALALLSASAAAMLASAFFAVRAAGVGAIFSMPLFWLGVIDALLAILLGAFSAKLFRFIRMRAALGFGFLAMLFWLQAQSGALASGAIASVCLWLATVFQARRTMAINTTAGLAALAMLTYCLLS